MMLVVTNNINILYNKKIVTMKKIILSLVIILITSLISYGQKKTINISKSNVFWEGHKITGSHEGLMMFKSGHLNFENNKLTGGSFIVDMQSISCTDLSGNSKKSFEKHLNSEDFFGTEKHPTSKLLITKVEKRKNKNLFKCSGDITIKNITQKIYFDIKIEKNKAFVKTKIDRSKFNIKYKSGSFFDGLGDSLIYDEFDLKINLFF